MSAEPIDLIGPKGYTHGWVYHGPGSGTRLHTGRLVSRDVSRARGSLPNASPSLMANRASARLRGRKGSDYEHLAAARLHMAAARAEKGASAKKARHIQMAAMHRGIARRNVGRQTASEGPMRRSSSRPKSQLAQLRAAEAAEKRKPGSSLGMVEFANKLPHAETTGGRKSALKRGLAIPPPSPGAAPGFPVTDAAHWDKARQAIGRVKNPKRRAQVAALLRRTAARFGKTQALKQSWVPTATAAGEVASVELATMPRYPVSSPYDVLIVRGEDGSAIVRHRRGGYEIGRIRRGDDGAWVAARDGKDGDGHTRQRGALLELIGQHNRASGSPYHRPEGARTEAPLQPPPVQTPLMAAYGIQNVRALATPARGASDGPRATEAGGDGKTGRGLSPRGGAIYAKLRKRGFPHERAHAFARRAQNRVRK